MSTAATLDQHCTILADHTCKLDRIIGMLEAR